MGSSMMLDIQEKYNQLTQTQKDMFAGYGLRQIKHFVEISLPKIEQLLPVGAEVQGINAEGKVQAYDAKMDQYYVWISDLQWQKSNRATLTVDLKTDAIAIWQLFELANHELVDLSHVHRDYLASLSES